MRHTKNKSDPHISTQKKKGKTVEQASSRQAHQRAMY